MFRILVVDDSEFDLAVIRKVFRTLGDWNAEFVSDGGVALSRMHEEKFDLILTDMHMPRMNGLDLIKCVHEREYGVPVVVMTSKGSEQIAIEALRCGAANYVIKKKMVKDLPEIVETVMRSQRCTELESQLLSNMSRAEFCFSLPNNRSLMNEAVKFIQDFALRFGKLPNAERTRLGIALEEALSNSMIHGNLEVSSELRQDCSDAWERQIEQRLKQQPYRDRRIEIQIRIFGDQLICQICDQGPGFDVAAVPDPTDPELLMRPSGRGMLLIRSFMDKVSYNARGNKITLHKNLSTSARNQDGHTAGVGPTPEELNELSLSSSLVNA